MNGIITVEGLTKKFGDFTAVEQLSLAINEGEIFGFLGPNGAGKTTSINMICGLLPPTTGQIKIFDKPITSDKQIKIEIGICPQENIFWPKLTCLEQLIFMGQMYGLSKNDARLKANQLLEWLGLKDKTNVTASKLSGGMKRRLNICLAIIHDPKIVVFDEPEAGLDPQSRILVRDFIKSLKKDKTIILTTHNMDEADRLADRVAIIDHGKLLLLDSPAELKRSIGEGDILEIVVDNVTSNIIDKVVTELNRMCDIVKYTPPLIILKKKKIIELIADITSKFKKSRIGIIKVTLRENTLEDVFIHLTGRKLRE